MAGRQDPRLEGAADSVNEKLRDRSISHLLFLLRNSTQQANEVRRILDEEVIPDVVSRLESRLARENFNVGTQRLQDLLDGLNSVVAEGRQRIERKATDSLKELAGQEARWQAGSIRESIPVNIETALPSAQQLEAVVTGEPISGTPLKEWFDSLEQSTQRNLNAAVRQGIVQGETNQQIVQRVRGTRANGFTDGALATTTRNAEAIVRTATIHTSNVARERTLDQNADVVKGVRWVATLDNRTCPTCQALDGRGDDRNGGALEGLEPLNGRRPPAHANCRCTVTPVTKSWREMGFDADELDESTRASMDGQVPSGLTYNQWLRRQVSRGNMDVVEEALGKRRAKLFSAGGLKVDQFVDRRGRSFTLDELRQREQSTFDRLNIPT